MKSKESLFYSGLNLLRPIFYPLILCENKQQACHLYLNPKLLFQCKKNKEFLFNFKFKSTGGNKNQFYKLIVMLCLIA